MPQTCSIIRHARLSAGLILGHREASLTSVLQQGLDTADKRDLWSIETWVPCQICSSPNRNDALDLLDSSTPVYTRLFLDFDGMDPLALVQTERIIMHRFRLISSESSSSTVTIRTSPIGLYAAIA